MTALLRFLRRMAGHALHGRFGAILRELRDALCRRRNIRALRASFSGKAAGRRVILFPPTLDWHLPLFQRPQQLALAYSRMENTLVLYLTANSAHDRVSSSEELSGSLFLINAALARELPPLLANARETILSLSWTVNSRYVELLRPDRLIYEYIDELEIFDGYDQRMQREHLRLLRRADLTVCTASALYEKARGLARRAILSPNAGDYGFFSQTPLVSPAPEAARAAARHAAVLGYYGALAAWFDYALIRDAARARPDWLFLLVGMDYDGSLKKSGLCSLQNVLWIPPQPYARLPSYLTLFDLALIPFLLNEVTASTSPVKLFEYMAAEKPILCSRMRECLNYSCVETYSDLSSFLSKSESLLRRRNDPALRSALRAEAKRNTWDKRSTQILSALDAIPSAEVTKSHPVINVKTISG